MGDNELKKQIKSDILGFQKNTLLESALKLFSTLGYTTKRQVSVSSIEDFKGRFLLNNLNEAKALYSHWKDAQFLFELQPDDLNSEETEITGGRIGDKDIETYWFYAIELKGDTYSKKQLSDITREVNKVRTIPAFILFKYADKLTFSIIDRRLNKKDENKDVLEKVVLIKDINFSNPHRAHIDILEDIAFKNLKVENFVDLHLNWLKALSVSELNKKFYTELSNWFFWMIDTCQLSKDNTHKDDIMFGIRMVTRIIFDWFIKEKGLVSEKVFDKQTYLDLLKPEYREQGDLYYKVVLQNLFFGCLSKPMDRREFRSEDRFLGKNTGYDVNNLFRYRKYLNNPQDIIDLFKDIPFLNGGLFECTDEKRNGKYIDCFTDNDSKNFLKIPDDIFFMEDEKVVDLSEHFDGNRSYKNAKVKGLFTILNSYKFTIDETTPVEEEIALDPELLGRVFENLLAAHNPETKITARKSTGSYYTPREIVDYMCEQSLINYLKIKVESLNIENIDDKLEELLSYSEQHSFNETEVDELIKAVNDVKILDPACGSGAFPMGLLHKLVHVLSKLDSHNEKWKESQIDKASQIDDIEAREEAIKIIEKQFNDNEMDYSRKLYLIQNCIFGVDIQPMATQISRLRFFISLIVDERPNINKPNMGILALPNLETKFVAANTLIDLNENNLFAQAPKIIELKKKLEKIREGYFRANTSQRKESLKTQDEKIREQIKQEAVILNLDLGQAAKLAQWSPYDKDYSSEWFNPKWMFNVDKFDIVIGNPPYVGQKGNKGLFEPFKKIEQWKNFYERKQDLYYYFIVKGIELLNINGIFSYIIPPYFTSAEGGKNLRQYIAENSNIHKIVNLNGKIKVFENASIDNLILFLDKKDKNIPIIIEEPNLNNDLFMKNMPAYLSKFSTNGLNYKEWYIFKDSDIVEIKSTNTVPLGQIATISPGIQTGCDKVSNSHIKNITDSGIRTGDGIFVISDTEKENLGLTDYEKKFVKPFYKNSDIFKFGYKQQKKEWIIITNKIDNIDKCPNLKRHLLKYKQILDARYRNFALINADKEGKWWYLYGYRPNTNFDDEKIVLPYRSKDNNFAYSNKSIYGSIDIFFININNYEYNTKYINAILCSKLLFYWLNHNCKRKGTTFEFYQKPLSVIPIKKSDKRTQNEFIAIVNKILELTQSDDYIENLEKQDAVKEYENQIDIMVYKLYDLAYSEVKTIDPNFSMSEQEYNNYTI